MSPINTHPVCSLCNFDLTGVPVQRKGIVTCPECGVSLRPVTTDQQTTRSDVHRDFVKRLLVPTAAPPLFGLVAALITPRWLMLFACLYLPTICVIHIMQALAVSADQLDRSRYYPRPYPSWSIPLWTILYSLPGLLLHTLVTIMLIRILNA